MSGQLRSSTSVILAGAAVCLFTLQVKISSQTATVARDPGVRGGAPGAGQPLPGLTSHELEYFNAGLDDFEEADDVEEGIGPRMNLDSCGGCHSQPAVGGTSPAMNPQVAFANQAGGTDAVPPFLQIDGPVREARFVKNHDGTADGGVHALFTVTGRPFADGCTIAQPDFATGLHRSSCSCTAAAGPEAPGRRGRTSAATSRPTASPWRRSSIASRRR